MINVFVVNMTANNSQIIQFAFHNLEEANKFKDYIDGRKGASSSSNFISSLYIYDSALQLMKKDK